MASSAPLVLAVLLAVSRVASAQIAPEPDPVPADPEPIPSPPEEPAPAPPEPAASTAWQRPDRGGIVGLAIGMAGATGASSDVYGPGIGLTLVLGLSSGPTSVEVRAGLGYATMPKQQALQGATTRGSFDTRAIIVRQHFIDGDRLGVSAFGGLATASIPLLSVEPVATTTINGTGLALGGAVSIPFRRRIELAAELTSYLMYWELPGRAYVRPAPGSSDDAAMISYTRASDDVAAVPWTVTVGLRVLID